MIERIKAFVNQEFKGNVAAFANAINLPQPSVNRAITGDIKPSARLLEAMLTAFPTLSAEWLMRGRSSMFTQIGDPNQTMLLNYLKNALEDERQRNEDLTRQLGEAREDLKNSPASSALPGDASTINRRRSA